MITSALSVFWIYTHIIFDFNLWTMDLQVPAFLAIFLTDVDFNYKSAFLLLCPIVRTVRSSLNSIIMFAKEHLTAHNVVG